MTEQPFAQPEDLGSRSTTQQEALRKASDVVRGLVGWHVFPQKAETLTVDGTGSDVVLLPTMRLASVAEVRSDGGVVDVDWSTAGYLQRRHGRFSSRLRGVQADVVHGYSGAPPDLADVVMALAERILEDPTLAHGSERLGDYSVGYGDLSTQHRTVLAKYTLGNGS